MKKTLSIVMATLTILSTLVMVAPKVKAEPFPYAWKDGTSFGLENDRLKLEGDYYHYNHGKPDFNYLLFKDTGTTWTSPWDDIIRCIPSTWKATGSVTVEAYTGTGEASITFTFSTTYYASTTLTVTTEFWITTEPYVRMTMHITNTGSQASDPFSPSLGYYTFIAGDTANDYYYIPGFGQGQYTGTQQNLVYTPTEPWMAAWDQNKEEGVGVVFTEGYSFPPDYVHIHDWYGLTAVAQGGWGYSEIQVLEVGKTSKDQAHLYFFTGTGRQKTKDFYDSHTCMLELTVTSSPIAGVPFAIDQVLQTTPYTDMVPEGSYVLEMPETHAVLQQTLRQGESLSRSN